MTVTHQAAAKSPFLSNKLPMLLLQFLHQHQIILLTDGKRHSAHLHQFAKQIYLITVLEIYDENYF